MEVELAATLSAFALVVAFVAWNRWHLWRRARFLDRLGEAVRHLGTALGGTDDPPEFDTIEDGCVVLKIDGKRVMVPVGDLLDTAMETNATRRNERLRWLVEKSRARTE